ncbi:MAG: DUF4239 domain-containing protein [Myxococcales bacterium]|nr:DUF4239 domain-containing protein [Myxococcales bacterium]
MKHANALGSMQALLPSVLGSIALSLGGLHLVRRLVPVNALRASNDSVGNYLQTVGTVYAVLLAFVVFVVWTQFNEARAQVEREANELMDLSRTAKGLPDPIASRVQASLADYVAAVLGIEWKAMEQNQLAGFDRGTEILEELWDVLHRVDLSGECQGAIYGEVLARFNDLSDARTNRLSGSRMRIPLALKVLLYTGAMITVGSLYMLAVDNEVIHMIITAAMAGAISHVLYLIHDLDNCFSGDWQVPREPFERLQRYVAAATRKLE